MLFSDGVHRVAMQCRASAAVGVLMTVAAQARAQRIGGEVTDSVLSQPLSGAVVMTIDSSGIVVARTLSDGAGRFLLPAGPRSVRLRAVRIGFSPRDVPLSPVTGDRMIAIAMVRIPSMLDATRVSSSELCPGSSDRGSAFQLWEQARAGLLATVVARESNPAYTATMTFERTFGPEDSLVLGQTTERHQGKFSRPFVPTAAPSAFASRGYAADDSAGGRTYDAPDADVLLDESFAATHCMRVERAESGHAGQVGLAFAPTRGSARDSLIDVAGTIWLDTATFAVRVLEFRYTGLEPSAERARTGGSLAFRTTSNGVAFIDAWLLRVPIMARVVAHEDSTRLVAPPVRRQSRQDYRVIGVLERGGQVLESRWDDGTVWRSAIARLRGVVAQRGSRAPLAHAVVTLEGTADSVVTDERGEFAFAPAPAARYRVIVADTSLRAYFEPRTAALATDVPWGETVLIRLELPALTDIAARACDNERHPAETSILVGRAVDPIGLAAEKGEVRAGWQADYAGSRTDAGGRRISGSVRVDSATQSSRLDRDGRFVICGVARERPIHLHLARGDSAADTTFKIYDSTLVKAVDWRPRLRRVPP
jgi:hypothetical protein